MSTRLTEAESSPKRRRKSSFGFSVLELLVSVGAASILLLAVPAVYLKLQKSGQDVGERMSSVAESLVGLRALMNQLENSGPTMSGLVDCGSPSLLSSCAGRLSCSQSLSVAIKSGGTAEKPIQFLYSDLSRMTGRDPSDFTSVSLTSPSEFPAGSLVLLSHAHRPDVAGLFKVSRVTATGLALADISAGTTLGIGSRCRVTEKQRSLRNLFTTLDARVYGSSVANVVKIERVRVASYGRAIINSKPVLQAMVFPAPSAPAINELSSYFNVTGLDRLRLETSFTKDSADTESGVFVAKVHFDYLNERGSSDSKEATATYRATRSLLKNFEVVTAVVAPAQTEDASCGFALERVAGQYFQQGKRFREFYLLSGTQSLPAGYSPGKFTASLKVSAPSDPRVSATMGCEELTAGWNPLDNSSPSLKGDFSFDDRKKYICELPPGATVAGAIHYFDSNLKSIRQVSCTPAFVPDGIVLYEYQTNSPPSSSCKKNGEINNRVYASKRSGGDLDVGLQSSPVKCVICTGNCNPGCGGATTDCKLENNQKLCQVQYEPVFDPQFPVSDHKQRSKVPFMVDCDD